MTLISKDRIIKIVDSHRASGYTDFEIITGYQNWTRSENMRYIQLQITKNAFHKGMQEYIIADRKIYTIIRFKFPLNSFFLVKDRYDKKLSMYKSFLKSII